MSSGFSESMDQGGKRGDRKRDRRGNFGRRGAFGRKKAAPCKNSQENTQKTANFVESFACNPRRLLLQYKSDVFRYVYFLL